VKTGIISLFVFLYSSILLAQTASEVCALNIGSEVPSVLLKSLKGEEVDIRTISAEKPTVLIFYRGGWCPYCTKHLSEIAGIEDQIKELGYQLVGISPDDIKDIPKTVNNQKIPYLLYSDRSYDVMNAFGISFKPSEKRITTYANVMKMSEKDVMVPVPSIFVIKNGVIQYRYVNPNYSTRISSEMLLAALKSLK